MTDHYSTLGVGKTATQDEIKAAYRKLASQHHPDKGGDTAKFQEIQIAYSVLNDPTRKAEYDQNPSGSDPWFNFRTQAGGQPQDMNDIFAHFFGRGAEPNPFDFFHGRQAPQRNRSINLTTSITLEDAFNGKELIADVTLPSGKVQTINVKIPAGIHDGTMLRLAGLGDNSIPTAPPGDIHLTVQVLPHRQFTRQGDDLIHPIPVMCIDAITGCKVNITTIDGKSLDVTINPGIQHDQVLSAPGYGMPNVNDTRFRGRLLMPIRIEIPTQLTEGQKEMLSKFHQS